MAWVPHSSTWPATTAPARASYDVASQPWWATAGPTTSDASVTRPVTTTSAPAVERGGDAEAAEVGVGGEGVVTEPEAAHVVALDVRDLRVQPEPGRDLAEPVGQARRG